MYRVSGVFRLELGFDLRVSRHRSVLVPVVIKARGGHAYDRRAISLSESRSGMLPFVASVMGHASDLLAIIVLRISPRLGVVAAQRMC